ncbi:MAG: hypothetical protein PHF29_06915 [Candidatus Riflebacteria bacterium]|jgi:hypothetical protein|nr:hypothetical protein [Candidatus Riflebacteria bacterium]MDD3001466.1 hypothetical protein [Candidatus Riflebacteria bacterium]
MMRKKSSYVCKMLLIALVAVLMQGVFHEALHASSSEVAPHEGHKHIHLEQTLYKALTVENYDVVDSEHCGANEDRCHGDHKTCSSLSCIYGGIFIIGYFKYDNNLVGEFFSLQTPVINLLNVKGAFFRPPIAFAV